MSDEVRTSAGAGFDCAVFVEEARSRLAAVLVGAGDDDLDTVLTAGQALSVLNDTFPPLPPLLYPEHGIAAVEGLPRALEALAKAGAAATRVTDAARFARAAQILATHPAITE